MMAGSRRACGEKILGLNAAGWAVDSEADAGDRWGGLPWIGGGCFRPVVLDAAKATNLGILAAIFANYAAREHDDAISFDPCEAFCHVRRYLMQNACQKHDDGPQMEPAGSASST